MIADVKTADVTTAGARTAWWAVPLALLPPTALAVGWRTWQGFFAFRYGLDSSTPQYQTYWLGLVALNLTVLPLAAAIWYAVTWVTGRHLAADMARDGLDPQTEVQRIWRLWLILAGFATAAYWGGSFFAEADAAWHQVTMRDTAFTPTHTSLFYGAFPVMIYASAGAFLYARSRLPHLFGGRGVPVAFGLLIGGSLLLLFQVAFNEFGHSFWQAEEVFSAPLHWPFVLFAYMLVSAFAIWLVSARRLLTLVRERDGSDERGLPLLPRRWDVLFCLSVLLLVMGGIHMNNQLLAGDWSFWADWKDRQWWPLLTPAVNIVLPAAFQYLAWTRLRLPIGATFAALGLLVAQWVSRVVDFHLLAHLPLNYVWPETVVVTAVLLDVTLLLSRSVVITSVVGSMLWGGLFWLANYPALAPFLQPVVTDGTLLTVADTLSAQLPRSQGPEYLRTVEQGSLRALIGDITLVVSLFAALLSCVTYWVGVSIGHLAGLLPIGRRVALQSDTDTALPAPARVGV